MAAKKESIRSIKENLEFAKEMLKHCAIIQKALRKDIKAFKTKLQAKRKK